MVKTCFSLVTLSIRKGCKKKGNLGKFEKAVAHRLNLTKKLESNWII